MYLLTLRDSKDEGAYAVQDKHGHKVLFLFEEEDDAESVLTHSVTLLNCFLACSSIFPGVSRGQLVTCTFDKLKLWLLWLNPDELTTTNFKLA